MISSKFNQVLATAVSLAAKLTHTETTVSHVVFILCEARRLEGWLTPEGVDENTFNDDLMRRLAAGPEFPKGSLDAPVISAGLAQCIHAAESVAASHGHSSFDARTFFALAVKRDHGTAGDNYAGALFARLQADGKTHVERLEPIGPDDPFFDNLPDTWGAEDAATTPDQTLQLPPVLAMYCTDLVAAAEAGTLNEVHGRDEVIDRLCKILGRRMKNNPILLGEAGVGKTSVVEALAMWIATGRAPAYLDGCRILSLDVGRIVAGTKYRGELEERFVSLLDALKSDRRFILFVDEIHVLVGADPTLAIEAKKMKPALASGEIRCIGATTRDEYSLYIENDPAMVRRFQEASVEEPRRDDAVEILAKVADSYGAYHAVTYDPQAVEAAVDLSIRYLVDRRLPDKAIDIIDEAATLVKGAGGTQVVTKREVLEVVRRMAKDKYIGNDDPAFWEAFKDGLLRGVSGHPAACAEIANALRLAAAHPVGRDTARASVLLYGPRGGGKRHVAKTTADLLGAPFLAIDMSEYMLDSSIGGLAGAKPGYIGYHDGGLLTEFVRKNPMCVIFIEAIEKAHESVRSLIATAVSEGAVKDSRGRTASFRNAVVFMSTDTPRSEGIGFSRSRTDDRPTELKDMMIDRAIRIAPLDLTGAEDLVAAKAAALKESYARGGVTVKIGRSVVEAVAQEGMSRGGKGWDVVQAFAEMVESALYAHGGRAVAEIRDGKVVFHGEAQDVLVEA
jgi:ATP-dependent Clp protease ATP-binding subunit ClpA